MSVAHAEIGHSLAPGSQEANHLEFAHRGLRAAVAKFERGLGSSACFDSWSGNRRSSRVAAPGPCSAKLDHTLAIRRKNDCKAGLCTSPTNCIQSAARRMHSNSYFRQLSDSGTAHLLDAWVPDRYIHRVSCRWSMPQRKADKRHKMPTARAAKRDGIDHAEHDRSFWSYDEGSHHVCDSDRTPVGDQSLYWRYWLHRSYVTDLLANEFLS
jgi:hypothetical protein